MEGYWKKKDKRERGSKKGNVSSVRKYFQRVLSQKLVNRFCTEL